METTSYIQMELLFKLSKRFETGGGRWLKFALKKKQKRGWSQQAEKDQWVFLQPNPPVSVWSLQTLLKWFQIRFWRSTFSAKLVFLCNIIKEQHHKTNPLNVAELHLGPPYNYILVWQTKALNSKPTKNTSHESTKKILHTSACLETSKRVNEPSLGHTEA